MASSKDYLNYVLDCLSDLDEISYRPMMGEYVIYYKGKVIGGIYDDRFLLKITKAGKALMPDAAEDLPYEGAKPMLSVENADDRALRNKLINETYGELPLPKKKKQ